MSDFVSAIAGVAAGALVNEGLRALAGKVIDAQKQASAQDQANTAAGQDWRVKLRLAPGANYLYKASDPGILKYIKETDGVIFPYTPAISVNYAASYDPTKITHSNYTIFQYTGSSVDSVSIACDFTCQDTFEAQYLLAVIHFFRSMTKMFYGQDNNPKNGTPPPLCYLSGMGAYQFSEHPLAITGFTYTLPTDVDYIRTTVSAAPGFVPISTPTKQLFKTGLGPLDRLLGLGATVNSGAPRQGGYRPDVAFTTASNNDETSWVPTKINLAISCVPIISRNRISNDFSLRDYASGALLKGSQTNGGGMW